MIKHPRLLWVLCFGKAWDTFSYFGTQTILMLYVLHVFHQEPHTSYLLYGAYVAFSYSLPVLGGILSDRFLGDRGALATGVVLNIIGNLVLMSLHRPLFCLGLALSLVGSGLYKSSSANLVGALYQHQSANKEAGFTWFYLFINIGGMLGPVVYGFIAYLLGWNWGFLCSALGICVGALWFFIHWRQWHKEQHTPRIGLSGRVSLTIAALIVLLIAILAVTFYFPPVINMVVCTVILGGLGYVIMKVWQHIGQERSRLQALLILGSLGMFYFAVGMQVGSSITLFVQSKIEAGIVKVPVPASTFGALYCLFVLVLAPFVTRLWVRLRSRGITLSVPTKLTLGIAAAALGMSVFAWAAVTNWVITGVLVGYLLLSAGELILTPAMYTAISDLSPAGMKSTMMGCWLLFTALGGYLGSLLASAVSDLEKYLPEKQYAYFGSFFCMILFTVVVVIIAAMLIPTLSKKMSYNISTL